VGDQRVRAGFEEAPDATVTSSRVVMVREAPGEARGNLYSPVLFRSPLSPAHGVGRARANAILALQRSAGNRIARQVLARELAIAPTVPGAAPVTLSPRDLQGARAMNRVLFTDADELRAIRDVLGISPDPAVADDDLSNAVAAYQASYGLKADGKIGPITSGRLAQEFTAESDALSQPAIGGRLRRTARRLHLRAMVTRTLGSYLHQGFVGPDDNPNGCVTVRADDTFSGSGNWISLEYTGEDANQVHWLQFNASQEFGTPPGAAAPVFATGSVLTSNGPAPWSSAGSPQNWVVDSVQNSPAASPSPFYDVSGFASTSSANRSRVMLDQPSGASIIGQAQAFAAAGPAAGSPTVTERDGFSTYLVKGSHPGYRVDWSGSTVVNIAAGTASSIQYRLGFAGPVTRLQADHRTALLAKYPGNPIN
jgi:hypothetical protein